jgi:hypothetical protein
MMLPEDMRLRVGRDLFVWLLIDVTGRLDVSSLGALGSPGKGRSRYDPSSRSEPATAFPRTPSAPHAPPRHPKSASRPPQ